MPIGRVMAEGVVVVTWNSAGTIAACLQSIPPDVPVVVVDNASSDETLAAVRAARPEAEVLSLTRNVGFGAACNLGAKHLKTGDVLLLNPDAALLSGTLERLAETLAREASLGVVGPLITDLAGNLELSWGEDPTLLTEWRRRREHARVPAIATLKASRVDWVTGACCLVRRSAWEAVEGFDERFFLYFEDLDLCRRIRKQGFGVLFEPGGAARHLRGASADVLGAQKVGRYRASQLMYYRRYASWAAWIGLRAYLVSKFAWWALRRPADSAVYGEVVRLALRGGERPSPSRTP